MQWIVGPGGASIDMSQPGALAAQLAELVESPVRRVELGKQGRDHCIKNFSRDRVVTQYLDYYRFVDTHDRSRNTRLSPRRRFGGEGSGARGLALAALSPLIPSP